MENKTKLKIADSALKISEKLFLAPYLAIIGYVFKFDNLSFLIIVLLCLAIFGLAVKFKNYAINLYDEVYSEIEK